MIFSNGKNVPALVEVAYLFAKKAHEGQFRKYARHGEAPLPYITHPVAVMQSYEQSLTKLEKQEFGIEEYCAAALLHDVVEDTPVTLTEIEIQFGSAVASAVFSLSKPEKRSGVNRKERNRDYLHKLLVASDHVKIIKLCDIEHNIFRISDFDDSFIPKYLRECHEIVDTIRVNSNNGNESLMNKVDSVMNNIRTEKKRFDNKHISWKEPKNAKR